MIKYVHSFQSGGVHQLDSNVHQLPATRDQQALHNDSSQSYNYYEYHNYYSNSRNQATPAAYDAWKFQSVERNENPQLKFSPGLGSLIDQSSNENFRSDRRLGKCQSPTGKSMIGVDGLELIDRRVWKQPEFHGSKDSSTDEKEWKLENPSNWKSESLDFSKIETFRNNESSSEENQESSIFQVNENVGHLIMSVIAKNIMEKYHQVTAHHDDGVPQDRPMPPKIKSEEKMHSSADLPLDLPLDLASFPRPHISVASLKNTFKNTFQRGHDDNKTGQSNLPDNKWCSLVSSTASGSNLTSAKKSRPKRGQYRRYNRQLLLEAVRAVQQGDMSVHRAGSYFGVPHSTLEYKVKERHLLRNKKSAQEQRLKSGYHGNDKSIPPLSVQPSPSCQVFPSREVTGDLVPNFSKLRKESELAVGLQVNAGDPRCGYRLPFYNEVILRNSMFYSGMFEGLPAPYGWLAPRFSKSPLFPLVYPSHSAMFVPSALEQLGSASDMLRKLKPRVQTDGHVSATSSSSSSSGAAAATSSFVASKSTGSGEDSSEPHSTSTFEVDLRVKVTPGD